MSPLVSRDDSGGAIAFAAYFVDAVDWSIATTDPYLLEQISAPTCEPCRSYIDTLNGLRAKGGHLTGGRTLFQSGTIINGTLVKADFVVRATYLQTQEVVTANQSAPPSTAPAPPNPAVNNLYMDWEDGHWILLDIGLPG